MEKQESAEDKKKEDGNRKDAVLPIIPNTSIMMCSRSTTGSSCNKSAASLLPDHQQLLASAALKQHEQAANDGEGQGKRCFSSDSLSAMRSTSESTACNSISKDDDSSNKQKKRKINNEEQPSPSTSSSSSPSATKKGNKRGRENLRKGKWTVSTSVLAFFVCEVLCVSARLCSHGGFLFTHSLTTLVLLYNT
jgi:hypothetical protein